MMDHCSKESPVILIKTAAPYLNQFKINVFNTKCSSNLLNIFTDISLETY